jgi:hypothetical protein
LNCSDSVVFFNCCDSVVFLNCSYIVAISIIGGGNQSTMRKPPTRRKSLSNFIT